MPRAALIDLIEETQTARGWAYDLSITTPEGRTTYHHLTLSWQDHDHWTGGSTPPSQLAERLLGLLIADGVELPARFDASTARRWLPHLDDRLTRAS